MIDFMTKKHRGSVTIFLIILLLPSFMFGGYIFDAARIDAAKTMISSSGDLALNAALSEYQEDLYDMYGVLATAKNPSELQEQVNMYFTNMIENNSMLHGTDSITLDIINGMKSYFNDPNQENFDNLVKMSLVGDIEINGVENSQIANPDTLKNQIVEYMKYRGPISMSSGLLTKLGTMSDLDQQAEVMNKKIEYEDKLSDIGEACQEAYDAINTYNDQIKSNDINGLLDKIKNIENDDMKYIYTVLSLQHQSNNKVEKYVKDNLSDKNHLTQYTQDELYQYIQKYFDDLSYFTDNRTDIFSEGKALKNLKNQLNLAYSSKNANSDEYPQNIYSAIQNLNAKKDEYTKLYFYCQQYLDNYVSGQDDEAKYKAVKNFFNNFAKTYTDSNGVKKESIIYIFQNKKVEDYSGKINEKFNHIQGVVKDTISKVDTLKSSVSEAIKKLDAIEDKITKAESARKEYGQAVDGLASSDYKSQMKAEYDNSAKDLNKENLKILKDLLKNYQKYINAVSKSLNDGGQFYGKNLKNSISSSALSIEDNTTVSSIQSHYKAYQLSGFDGSYPKIITNQDKFYAYLSTLCKETEENENSEAKSNLDKLLGNNDKSTINNIKDNSISEELKGNGNQSVTSKDMQGKENSLDPGEYDKDKTPNVFTTFLSSTGDLLKSITNIKNIFDAENSRDTLYLAEYMTEMFSYYTIVQEEGENPVSLSGMALKDNPFYRSEIEYILCGNDSPKNNISAVKSKIFVTRFVLNLLYAMTDTSINSTARVWSSTICAGMPFMIPVVKTLIVCGFAMGETSLDMMILTSDDAELASKGVAFIKNSETFLLKPNNFAKGFDTLIKSSKDKIINFSNRSIDNITNMIFNKSDDVLNQVREYTNSTVLNMTDNVKSTISSALSEKVTQILSQYQQSWDIDYELKTTLLKVQSSSKNNIVNEAINFAKSEINQQLSTVSEKLIEVIDSLKNGNITMEKGIEEVNLLIDRLVEKYNTKIQNYITEKTSSFTNQLIDEIDKISQNYKQDEKMKAQLTEEINTAFNEFSQQVGTGSTDQKTSSSGSSAGAGFTLTYKEYLKMFVILQCLDDSDENSQRDQMLKRVANLIQINLSNKNNDNSVNINDMYTMITMKGTVDVETSFLNIPIVEKNGKKDFDFDNLLENKRSIEYKSVRGY